MKQLVLYILFLLISFSIGSQVTDSKDQESINSSESIESDGFDFDPEDPEFMKQNFIFSLMNAQLAQARIYVEKYDYLTNKFNRDIFTGFMKCFDKEDKEDICWEIFEILKPSFFDVSRSTTTPLILAIRQNKMSLVNALLKLDEIKSIIDKIDEFERTALMYAAKRGSLFAVKRILDISSASLNFKDFLGKTAIHYACEMNPLAKTEQPQFQFPSYLSGAVDTDVDNKSTIVAILMAYGGQISQDGPGYNLNSADWELEKLLTDFGGKVFIEDKVEDMVRHLGTGLVLAHIINKNNGAKVLNKMSTKLMGVLFANPMMLALNELCFEVMQALLPGIDANFNFSIEVDDTIHDYSFNLLFVLMMIPVFKHLMEIYVRKQDAF